MYVHRKRWHTCLKRFCSLFQSSLDYGNTNKPSMDCRLGSVTVTAGIPKATQIFHGGNPSKTCHKTIFFPYNKYTFYTFIIITKHTHQKQLAKIRSWILKKVHLQITCPHTLHHWSMQVSKMGMEIQFSRRFIMAQMFTHWVSSVLNENLTMLHH